MKKSLTKFLALGSMALLVLASCKKNDPVIKTNGGTPGALTANASTYILDKSKITDTTKVVNFSFSKATFGYSAAVTNTLQIDAAGDNWAKPTSVTLGTNVLSQGYTTSEFNTLLLKLNLAGGVASQVQVRVQHVISASVAPVYSNVLSLTVTPYNLSSFLYVVGQFNGYNASSPDSLLSATSNGIYIGIINFTPGNNRFLILPAKNYNNKYATTDAPNVADASLSYTTEYVSGGGSDLYAPTTAGNYIITLNTNNNTITVQPANSYSVIGSVTPGGNYSTDDDLKFVNSTDQDWEAVLPLTYGTFPGGFKVRQNHDWTWSWGTIPTADGKSLTDNSGGNIPVATSGNYKVSFAIPLSVVSATDKPPVNATYILTPQ